MTLSWAYMELMGDVSDMPWQWIQYLNLLGSPLVLHNKHYEVTCRILEVWGGYEGVLGQCGTHERWFRHTRALDTLFGSTQDALLLHNTTRSPAGSWRYGEGMTSSWAYVELMRDGSHMPWHLVQYLDLFRTPLVLHNTTKWSAESWRYGEGLAAFWAYVELMRVGSNMLWHWIQYLDLLKSP